jgi:hypothetical protein
MDMRIDIRGLEDFKKRVDQLAKKQVPYALASALNSTAFGAMKHEQAEIKDSFDRPTPWVQKGVLYEKASAASLAAYTRIAGDRDRKGNVQSILAPHVYGGGRSVKGSERRLRRTGAMGGGQFIVPGPGAPIDIRYGNIPGGQMKRLLGFAKQYTELGYNVTKQTQGHYVIPFVGLFKRNKKGRSTPVLFFTYKAPKYEERFDFHYAARIYFNKNFHANMNQAWNRALTSTVARGL